MLPLALQRAVHNRLVCIGDMKLTGWDTIDNITRANHHVD